MKDYRGADVPSLWPLIMACAVTAFMFDTAPPDWLPFNLSRLGFLLFYGWAQYAYGLHFERARWNWRYHRKSKPPTVYAATASTDMISLNLEPWKEPKQ